MDIREQAKAFAEEHLAQCSWEVVQWRRTGILPEGKLRELEAIVEKMGLDDATRQAEGFVVQAALEKVVRDEEKKVSVDAGGDA